MDVAFKYLISEYYSRDTVSYTHLRCRRRGAVDVPLGFRGRWPEHHRRAAERSGRSHPQPLPEDAGQDHSQEFAR